MRVVVCVRLYVWRCRRLAVHHSPHAVPRCSHGQRRHAGMVPSCARGVCSRLCVHAAHAVLVGVLLRRAAFGV